MLRPLPKRTVVVLSCVFSTAVCAAEPDGVRSQREYAVLVAKKGDLNAAIQTLSQLHGQYPHDGRVTADLILLLRQAGRNQEIQQLTQGLATTAVVDQPIADYALMAWASALRDQRAFSRAQQVLAPTQKRLGVKAQLLYAMVSAEAGQSEVAMAALPNLNAKLSRKLTAADLAQMAYVCRLSHQPARALALSKLALQKDPRNKAAQQEASYATAPVQTDPLRDQREQAVREAKKGDLDGPIDKLLQLHAQEPKNGRVMADLIILLRQAGRNQEIEQLTQGLTATAVVDQPIADYALMTWAAALRDQQQFARAQQVLAVTKQRLGLKAQLLYAVVSVEAGQFEVAFAALPKITPQLDATDLGQMAYVYRLGQRPSRALAMSQLARQKDATNPVAIQESVYALSALNATVAAYQLALKNPTLFNDETLRRLRTNDTMMQLRDATAERARLDERLQYGVRNQPLEAALAAINLNLRDFPHDSPQYRRNQFDRIDALRLLNRMPETIAAYQQLNLPITQIPLYVQRDAADAYLAQRQPQIAGMMYLALLQQQNDAPLYLAYYRALIESEDYRGAAQVLAVVKQATPTRLASRAVGAAPIANWERLDVDQTVALDAAYRNDLEGSAVQLADLFNRAPSNVGVINDYATVLRWRGWPQRADQLTALAASAAPQEPATRINIAANARDLEQIPRWRDTVTALQQQLPDNTEVQRSYVALQDRNRPSISSELTVGRSTGGNTQNIDVNGSRDLALQTRINTPWLYDSWRGFVQQDSRWSDLGAQKIEDNQAGVGVEWSDQRRNGWLLVSQQLNNDQRTGLSAGWSQWLNDYWQYGVKAAFNSSDTPLRALAAGYTANSANANLTWRQSESRSAYAMLGLMDINDGNQRQTAALGASQRIMSGDHFVTTLGLDVYREHNSQSGGVYYNPKSLLNTSLRLQQDWVTWREYEQSLTQNFQLTAGLNQEADFGTASTYDVLYQHVWQLTRTWKLHYGVSWGSHVYSGQREGRLAGVLGAEGVF